MSVTRLAAVRLGSSPGPRWTPCDRGSSDSPASSARFQRLGDGRGSDSHRRLRAPPDRDHATLDAARATYPRRRIVAAFQPHLYTRTRDLATEFGSALAAADVVFLTDIYPAREQPIAGVTADLIATAAAQAGRA